MDRVLLRKRDVFLAFSPFCGRLDFQREIKTEREPEQRWVILFHLAWLLKTEQGNGDRKGGRKEEGETNGLNNDLLMINS